MKKKDRIKALESRVAELEAELLRVQRPARIEINWPPAPNPSPGLDGQWWRSPWICTTGTQVIKTDPSIKTYTWN